MYSNLDYPDEEKGPGLLANSYTSSTPNKQSTVYARMLQNAPVATDNYDSSARFNAESNRILKQVTQYAEDEIKKNVEGKPEIPRDTTGANIIYMCMCFLFLAFYFCADLALPNTRGIENFCGIDRFRFFNNGWISWCGLGLLAFMPAFVSLFILTGMYFGLEKPWGKAHTPLARSSQQSTVFKHKMILIILYLAINTIHLIFDLDDVDFGGTENVPGIAIVLDVLQITCFVLIAFHFFWNYRAGEGHPYYIRAFTFVVLISNFLVIPQIRNQLWNVVLTSIEVVILAILFFYLWQAWKDPSLEDLGGEKRKISERNVPAWSELWPLLAEFNWLFFWGGLGSVVQGLLFNLSVVYSAGLMKGSSKSEEELIYQTKLFIMLSMGVGVTRCFCQNMYGLMGQKVTLHIKRLMFANFIAQDATFLHQKENVTGTLVSRLNTDTEVFGAVLTLELQEMMKPFFQTIVGIVMLFVLDWKLAMIFVCLLVFLNACMLARSVKVSAALSRKYSDKLSLLSARGLETLKGIDCVHQYQQEENELKVYTEFLVKTYKVAREKVLKESWFKGYEAILLAGIQALTLWYGGYRVLDPEDPMSADILLQFALVCSVCVKGCEDVDKGVPVFMAAAGSAVRVCEKIYAPHAQQDDDDSGFIPEGKEAKLVGKIEFRDVCFRYPASKEDSEPVLGPNLNFVIQPGEACAFVGESGCGKSTTISLINRDYHVKGLPGFSNPYPSDRRDKGYVLLDDRDIRTYNRSWLLKQIGVVSQMSVIFNTSIEENIAYGRAEHRFDTDEQKEARKAGVIDALAKAAAWNEFINNELNPNNLGLHYQCGQDGCNLSGGQKQRISIARMIYKNPSLFIFDEVTSALDAGSERKVMATLVAISTGHTSFLVAHRLNTIKHANNIICLRKGGTIIERGHHPVPIAMRLDKTHTPEDDDPKTAHEKLLANRNAYARLFGDQSF